MLNNTARSKYAVIGGWHSLWLLLVLVPLFSRTYLQIDETRYVAVAWEMWLRGDWLVPYLNGEAYSHKPPLLFWLFNLGWAFWGVNAWWPRVVPGLFSLASLWLTFYLARQLWPQQPAIAHWSPWVLLSCLLWSLFTSVTMFDLMLTTFVLLGLVALLIAAKTPTAIKAWGLFSIAIGLGLLTKGPVILLHVLPIALCAPFWQPSLTHWHYWYFGIFVSVLIGGALALVWAIPAGIMGGAAYQQAIFWGQTAHRLVNSFAHEHPLGWYLPFLPVILFPWLLWLAWWRSFIHLPQLVADPGVRFCLIGFAVGFISFSLISGKQLHYLLPLFPAFALLTTYLVLKRPVYRWDLALPALFILLAGLVLWKASALSAWVHLPAWSTAIAPLPGFILMAIGGLLLAIKWTTVKQHLLALAFASASLSLLFPLTVLKAAGPAYDLRAISQYIKTLQRQEQVVAHLGDYHGQYQFFGRLDPIPVVDEYNLCTWLTQYPDSKLIIYFSRHHPNLMSHAEYYQPYRSHYVGIVDVQIMYSACLQVMPLI